MNLKFKLELKKLDYSFTKPSIDNERITGSYKPFLLAGFDDAIEMKELEYIPLNTGTKVATDILNPNRVYSVTGVPRGNIIPYDTKFSYNFFILQENYSKVPAYQRLGEARIGIRNILPNRIFKLEFKNKLNKLVVVIYMTIVEFKVVGKAEEKNNNVLQDITENKSKIEQKVNLHINQWFKSYRKLFTNYHNGTKNVFVLMDFNYNGFRPTTAYLTMNLNPSNEAFYKHIFESVMLINWVEVGQGMKLKEPTNQKEFIENLYIIFSKLTILQQLNVLMDMAVLISTSSVYLGDFVELGNGSRKTVEDFFNCCEGSDDCEGLANFIMYVIDTFTMSGPYKNNILERLRMLRMRYILFLSLDGVSSPSLGHENNEDKVGGKLFYFINPSITAHMNCIIVRKGWIFEGDVNEDQVGKIIINPLFEDKRDTILRQLIKIKNYEKSSGYLKSTMNGEKLPNLGILEGTGFFNGSGQKNPLAFFYNFIKKLINSYGNDTDMDRALKFRLRTKMKSKIYHEATKKSSFFKLFIVELTKFFTHHVKYPCNIPSLTLTYRLEYNRKVMRNSNMDGYIYGVNYIDLINANPNIRLLANAPYPNFKEYIELSDRLSKSRLKYNPLYLIKGKTGISKFRKRKLDKYAKEHIPSPPNVAESVTRRIHKDLNKQLKRLYPNRNYNINHVPEWKEIHKALVDKNRMVGYYTVKPIVFDAVKDSLMRFLEDHKKFIDLISIHKITLLPNVAFYFIVLEIVNLN